VTGDRAPERPLWRRDEHRFVALRSSYLTQTADLRDPVAEAVAWSELGYSESGIAKRVNRAEATVGTYLDDVAERYGAEAIYARTPEEIHVDADLPGADGGVGR
jgi:predicted transcriptional regulator